MEYTNWKCRDVSFFYDCQTFSVKYKTNVLLRRDWLKWELIQIKGSFISYEFLKKLNGSLLYSKLPQGTDLIMDFRLAPRLFPSNKLRI